MMPFRAVPWARSVRPFITVLISSLLLAAIAWAAPDSREEREREAAREREVRERTPVRTLIPGKVPGTRITSTTAIVNLADLARQEALGLAPRPPVRPRFHSEEHEENEMGEEPGAELFGPAPESMALPPRFVPFVASPSPSASFMGLDDIPMADSSYIVIPPDVHGGVGPTRVMESFNNNYRVRDKTTGATLLTVGTATFWNPVVTDKSLLNGLTDPRTVYDPINGRWIVCMQTTNVAAQVLIGVSQTSDPAGSWFLYSFGSLAVGGYLLDFPTLGFNKNWIAVTINRYSTIGSFQRGIAVVVSYPQARAGTLTSATVFTQAASTHFCTAPCVTLSSTQDSLFLVTHLGSAGATYTVDVITGTVTPVYTSGGTLTRPGGGWVQPAGNQLPQSAPNAGASACGATPCPIETQDSQVRSEPIYRVDSTTGKGFIYYTQTVGLPAGAMTHTAVQWTKITPSITAAFADGGRIEDPTATSTNGGKWYAFPHIAVNSVGDFIVGYSQFSSAQHPASGYSVHFAAEGLASMRDALIYKAGEDYYHKTFTTATGRNRWGDFSKAQVDPNDDRSLWVLQEYAKTRTGTDDGNTGSNSSRWSSYWANVAGPPPTVTIAPGASQAEGNAGLTPFVFTVDLSTAYSLPVTVSFQTADGSATVADNDYQTQTGAIVIPVGSTSGTITVNAVGDTQGEPDETFSVSLTGATNGTLGSPSSSTGTIVNDDFTALTITATAGANGSISPNGAVSVNQGSNQIFTITPSPCYHVEDVLVDGSSVGPVASYTFTNIQTDHTIHATFVSTGLTATETHTDVSCTGLSNGSIDLTVANGVPPYGYAWSNGAVTEDLIGLAVGSYTVLVTDSRGCPFSLKVTIGVVSYTITASAGANGAVAPPGGSSVACGTDASYTITPDPGYAIDQLIVDGSPITPAFNHTFANVSANHTLSASFMPGVLGTEAAPRDLTLGSVVPNPTTGAMQIRLGLPTRRAFRMGVVDLQGREIAVMLDGMQPAGWVWATWNGRTAHGPAPAGVYFVRFQGDDRNLWRRFALVR